MAKTQHSIGNDIVDFAAVGVALHSRYLDRVFSNEEQVRIGDSGSRFWQYWAAKESAYKAYKRIFPNLKFSPISFTFNHENSLVVSTRGAISCESIVTDDFVYVSCAMPTNPKKSGCEQSQAIESWIVKDETLLDRLKDSPTVSARIRTFAIKTIAKKLEIESERIYISNETYSPHRYDKIPLLFVDSKPSTRLISLSHDGRFLAFALG